VQIAQAALCKLLKQRLMIFGHIILIRLFFETINSCVEAYLCAPMYNVVRVTFVRRHPNKSGTRIRMPYRRSETKMKLVGQNPEEEPQKLGAALTKSDVLCIISLLLVGLPTSGGLIDDGV
jgi:hypothetical protein